MEDENIVDPDTSTEGEKEENKPAEDKDSEELNRLREDNKKLFARAKKAEGFTQNEAGEWIKKDKPEHKPEPKTEKQESKKDLSATDIIHITKADLHEDDVDRVIKWANDNGQSIKEALADGDLKAILANRGEMRKSATVAASTRSDRRGTSKPVYDRVIEEAKKGNIPEAGTPEARALFRARRGLKPE